jgi:hypothetical protein
MTTEVRLAASSYLPRARSKIDNFSSEATRQFRPRLDCCTEILRRYQSLACFEASVVQQMVRGKLLCEFYFLFQNPVLRNI